VQEAEQPIVVPPGHGHRVGNVEFLARTADTPRFNLGIVEIAPGRELEAHVHDGEDDAFYILEGEMTFASEYRGHERAAKFWRQMHEPWESFSIEVEHVEDQDDWAVASIRFRGCGRDSGVEVDMRFGMAMRMHDGRALQLVNRPNFDEARKAVAAEGAGAKPSR